MKENKEEVKIEKLTLNIDGEKVTLSIEQAKKLKKVLEELFGKEIIKEVVKEIEHHYHRDYYWDWNKPYVTWGDDSSVIKPIPNVVYCSTSKSLDVNI